MKLFVCAFLFLVILEEFHCAPCLGLKFDGEHTGTWSLGGGVGLNTSLEAGIPNGKPTVNLNNKVDFNLNGKHDFKPKGTLGFGFLK